MVSHERLDLENEFLEESSVIACRRPEGIILYGRSQQPRDLNPSKSRAQSYWDALARRPLPEDERFWWVLMGPGPSGFHAPFESVLQT
jgi:hypothetical protein